MHTEFWLERQKERDRWKDLNVGERIISKWTLEKDGVG
jgi:hypothetical protein